MLQLMLTILLSWHNF